MQGKNWEAEAKELSYQLVATQTSLQNVQNQYNTVVEAVLSKTDEKIESLEQLLEFIGTLEAVTSVEEVVE